MCGIAGYALPNSQIEGPDLILRMTRLLARRGPDDEGITLIRPATSTSLDLATSSTATGVMNCEALGRATQMPHGIAFGHRRFTIVDLTPGGHQPFWPRNREVCVNFNGEIYNYIELREELVALGHKFWTDSDTEVLTEAYLEWGVECFKRFNGFWALSLYDARRRAVLLSRDRIGKAPLYVARTIRGLFWASEIKSVLAATGSIFPLREQAVIDFALNGWRDVFHETFFQGIVTFPNAAYAWIEPDGTYEPQTFWTVPGRRMGERQLSAPDAVETFRELLSDSLRIRRRADVPVGFELSGGSDSSALVGLAARTGKPLAAFTVSFAGTPSDEEPFARAVAANYPNTIDYTVLPFREENFFDQADEFVWLMEEPFHAPNLLTHQGVWQAMARAGLRVSISGAAGDELLAGYVADYHAPYLRTFLRTGRVRSFVREFARLSETQEEAVSGRLLRAYRLIPDRFRPGSPARFLRPSPDPLIRPNGLRSSLGPSSEINHRLIDLMGHWRMNYWMRSSNKASMGVPLELRLPFLDHRVVDFAFQLPLTYLIRDGWLKWVLRKATNDVLPASVVWRRQKRGFPFPWAPWFAASKDRFFSMVGALDCPYVDLRLLRDGYGTIAARNPLYLWRLISIALWWKRCVRGDRLS